MTSPAQVAAHDRRARGLELLALVGPRRPAARPRRDARRADRDARSALEGLPEGLAARLAERLGLDRRPLRLSSQAERSRERNREIVLERLERRIAAALAPEPPPRRPTRPTRAARERRLADKTRRAALKSARRPPDPEA